MASLTISSGPNAGSAFSLSCDNAGIGRDHDCEISLSDEKVSRFHAMVLMRGESFVLRDLGSSNGTYLNNKRIDEAELSPGDVVRVGRTEMTFELRRPDTREATLTGELSIGATVELRTGELDMLDDLAGDEPGGPARALLTLSKVARELAGAGTRDGLYAVLAVHLAEGLESDRVYVLEPGEGDEWLIAGMPETMGALDEKLLETPVSKTIVSHVATERVAALMVEPDDERFGAAVSIVQGRIVTAAAAPLVVRDELIAVLYADRLGRGEPFGEAELEMLAVSASLAALHAGMIDTLETTRRGKRRLEKELRSHYEIVGESPEMNGVFDFIERAAPTDAGVLILGESGTGKELVARAIHFASQRSDGPFEVVNCAALAESLAESELFGHAKGAFTGAAAEKPGRFELADGGTLFLDEVGELSPACQSKLLRVLENGESVRVGEAKLRHVNVRVVAATNRDLDSRVKSGEFREDLFYRLNVLRIVVPPLRERQGDMELLRGHFLSQFAARAGREAPVPSTEAAELLSGYGWPGNVRELRNICERLVVMARGDEIAADELPPEITGGSAAMAPAASGAAAAWDLKELERGHIMRALDEAGGNRSKAARMLGIDRSTLYAKLKLYGEDVDDPAG